MSTDDTKLKTNLLHHGVADTLGSIGAIMPATVSREFEEQFGVPRSTATGSPKGLVRRGGSGRHPRIAQRIRMAFTLPL
jgi:hypothetical protein